MVLSYVEIVARNAMHTQLTAHSARTYSESLWYLDPGKVLSSQATKAVVEAKARIARDGKAETPGRIVSELSFGFWRFLLAARYERTLWNPALRAAFPGMRGRGWRRDAYDAMFDVHQLRNRIAHHEPIHNRELAELHETALRIVGWICPDTRQFVADLSQVPRLLTRRP